MSDDDDLTNTCTCRSSSSEKKARQVKVNAFETVIARYYCITTTQTRFPAQTKPKATETAKSVSELKRSISCDAMMISLHSQRDRERVINRLHHEMDQTLTLANRQTTSFTIY